MQKPGEGKRRACSKSRKDGVSVAWRTKGRHELKK